MAFESKLPYVHDYLLAYPGDRIVVFVDSFDSLVYCTPRELHATYRNVIAETKSASGMVMGTEITLWPDPSLAGRFPSNPPTDLAYPNSGVYIGPAESIINALGQAIELQDGDDQYGLQLAWLDNPELFALDYHADITTSMFFEEPSTIINVTFKPSALYPHRLRPLNQRTGRSSCVLHFNGEAKVHFPDFVAQAWWSQTGTPYEEADRRRREDEFELWSVSSDMRRRRMSLRELRCPRPGSAAEVGDHGQPLRTLPLHRLPRGRQFSIKYP